MVRGRTVGREEKIILLTDDVEDVLRQQALVYRDIAAVVVFRGDGDVRVIQDLYLDGYRSQAVCYGDDLTVGFLA